MWNLRGCEKLLTTTAAFAALAAPASAQSLRSDTTPPDRATLFSKGLPDSYTLKLQPTAFTIGRDYERISLFGRRFEFGFTALHPEGRSSLNIFNLRADRSFGASTLLFDGLRTDSKEGGLQRFRLQVDSPKLSANVEQLSVDAGFNRAGDLSALSPADKALAGSEKGFTRTGFSIAVTPDTTSSVRSSRYSSGSKSGNLTRSGYLDAFTFAPNKALSLQYSRDGSAVRGTGLNTSLDHDAFKLQLQGQPGNFSLFHDTVSAEKNGTETATQTDGIGFTMQGALSGRGYFERKTVTSGQQETQTVTIDTSATLTGTGDIRLMNQTVDDGSTTTYINNIDLNTTLGRTSRITAGSGSIVSESRNEQIRNVLVTTEMLPSLSLQAGYHTKDLTGDRQEAAGTVRLRTIKPVSIGSLKNAELFLAYGEYRNFNGELVHSSAFSLSAKPNPTDTFQLSYSLRPENQQYLLMQQSSWAVSYASRFGIARLGTTYDYQSQRRETSFTLGSSQATRAGNLSLALGGAILEQGAARRFVPTGSINFSRTLSKDDSFSASALYEQQSWKAGIQIVKKF